MIVTAKKLPLNKSLGDVVVTQAAPAPFSIMQYALFGFGAWWLYKAWRGR